MGIADAERALLQEILEHLIQTGQFPNVQQFRASHESQRALIDGLLSSKHLTVDNARYVLTIEGLQACGSREAKGEVEACDALLPVLQEVYRSDSGKHWPVQEIAERAGKPVAEVARSIMFLAELPIHAVLIRDPATGLIAEIRLAESVLDVEPIGWFEEDSPGDGEPSEFHGPTIQQVEITGYRPFEQFQARPGNLTAIIGANASGKSSLFEFLRFVSFAASNPLPPEIDPGSVVGKMLFHSGGPERIDFALVMGRGQSRPLRYEVEILGPVGSPKIVRERLATAELPAAAEQKPFVFLDFRNGKGVVRDQRGLTRPGWTVQPNEFALRRALDPTLVTLSKFQSFVSSWRFYSGFDVSADVLRRPVPTEPAPTLAENGSNLSAVLFSLQTDDKDAWQELETHLRSAIPNFQALNVKPRGGPGTVIGVWRERGVRDELTFADLSDGTLRLLCWATLCLAPSIPPLICIDEPELGLHPRVLPMLAGLLRMASARSQILVATHSPYFLAQFRLDEIAVMRKEDGRARFIRPDTSAALRREVEEFGGDAIAQLHISDELEVRP